VAPERILAADIGGTDCISGSSIGFHPPVYNFLANGDASIPIASLPRLPTADPPRLLGAWKFCTPSPTCCQRQGFDDCNRHSVKGVSLLFDPLVDAFLLANCAHHGNPSAPPKRTVIVLTDYGPVFDKDVNLQLPGTGTPCKDWASREIRRVFNSHPSHNWKPGRRRKIWRHDLTTEYLMKAICGARPWLPCKIACRGVWVWNFIPFLRGGFCSCGMAGLPYGGSLASGWVHQCLEWLCRFSRLVNATQIAWCTSEEIRGLALGSHVRPYTSTLCSHLPVLVLRHPCTWRKYPADSMALNHFI
jgi:hypothetical protein